MFTRSIRRLLAPLALLALSAGAFGAQPASAGTPRHLIEPAAGTFVGAPFTITDVVPEGALFHIEGFSGDHWNGTLTGDTSYTGSGTYDPATGAVSLIVQETFTGTVSGFGSGVLHLVEYLHQSTPGDAVVDCLITSGTGDLAGIRGVLEFRQTGVTDPDPNGNGGSTGNYIGVLTR